MVGAGKRPAHQKVGLNLRNSSRRSQDLNQQRKHKYVVCNSTSGHKIEPLPQSLHPASLLRAGAPEPPPQVWDYSCRALTVMKPRYKNVVLVYAIENKTIKPRFTSGS